MFEMHILLISACAEEAEIWCNSECFIAYSAPWAQMEWILKKPKCEVLSWWASWFLMVQKPTLFMDLLFFILFLASEQVSVSVDGIVMAEERQGCNWKGHTQGVRGDTEKSISLHFHSIHMPNSVFRLTGFNMCPTCFLGWWEKGKRNQFPISLNYTRFIDILSSQTKRFYPGNIFILLTVLNENFICIYFVAFKQRQNAFLTQCHSELRWGGNGGLEGAGWMGATRQVLSVGSSEQQGWK